eukprot:gene15993-biopygen9723
MGRFEEGSGIVCKMFARVRKGSKTFGRGSIRPGEDSGKVSEQSERGAAPFRHEQCSCFAAATAAGVGRLGGWCGAAAPRCRRPRQRPAISLSV